MERAAVGAASRRLRSGQVSTPRRVRTVAGVKRLGYRLVNRQRLAGRPGGGEGGRVQPFAGCGQGSLASFALGGWDGRAGPGAQPCRRREERRRARRPVGGRGRRQSLKTLGDPVFLADREAQSKAFGVPLSGLRWLTLVVSDLPE